MTRRTRTQRTPAASRQRAAAATVTSARQAQPAPENWSSALVNYWSAWPEQMRRIAEQTVLDLERDAELEDDEVQHASTPQDLWSRQAEYAGEVWTRLARSSVQFTGIVLDAQAAWLREVEARTAQLMQPWLDRDRQPVLASAQPLFDPPQPVNPTQAVEAMQRLWSESTKLWFNAISHDLQAGGASTR